nr:nucleotidyltransferase domain-containing protein [Chelatococcus sambhunathii]
MTMSREHLLRSLSELEPRLKARGVTHLALFGTRAREDNRPDSDVDVAIEVDPGAKFSLIDLVGVEREIQEKTSLPGNVFMRRSLEPDFATSLARDGIQVF